MSNSDYNGLTRNQWPGTWSSSNAHPIALDTELRGTLQYVSGSSGDRLTDITGQRLQEGMLVYVKTGYTVDAVTRNSETYYQYKLLGGESRNPATGAMPNSESNWSEFVVSGGGGGGTGYGGSVGYQGSMSAGGYQGSLGATGYRGSIGTTGYEGSKGLVGFQGSMSFGGYRGSLGESGYKGSAGSANPSIRQRFTATGYQNTFTVTGGYTPYELDIFLNGVKLTHGTDVDVSSGTTFGIYAPPPAGSVIEALSSFGSLDGITYVTTSSNYTLNGSITFSNTVYLNTSNVFWSKPGKKSLFFGSSNTYGGLQYNGDGGFNFYYGNTATGLSTDRQYKIYIQTDGSIITYDRDDTPISLINPPMLSDIKLKHDITPTAVNAINIIKSIPVVDFKWKEDSILGNTSTINTGFIAQEVIEEFPNAIKIVNDTLMLRKDELVPVLWKALQDALNKIESLEARVNLLENTE